MLSSKEPEAFGGKLWKIWEIPEDLNGLTANESAQVWSFPLIR